jgi:diacylglycerol O-acyltransferase
VQRMSGMDAAFLYFETPTMHMHVVGVLVLDGSDAPGGTGFGDVMAALEQRIHLIPSFRRRVVSPPVGIDHPVWIEDPDFDLAGHVMPAPLGAPVTWSDLERFVGDVAGRPLDRGRPLWEMWVVEGFDDGTVALVTKLHHSIMDGAAGGDLMASLFDLTPGIGEVPAESTPWRPDEVPPATLLAARSLMSLPRYLWEAPRAVAQTAGSLGATSRAWIQQRASGRAAPLTAPRTILNGPTTAHRSVSLKRVDLDEVREIRQAFDTTINDVVLAATATSLREYLIEHHAPVAGSLIAAVPVNARADRVDGAGIEPGNHVSSMMVPLPLEPDDPVERLRAVHAHALASKALHSAFGMQSLEQLTGFLSPTVTAAAARLYSSLKLARLHPPVCNVVVSNIPGPPVDLYCAGARVAGIFAMGPVIEGTALNLTVLSEAHHLNVGIMACPALVPVVEEVGAGFVAAIRELALRARLSSE